MITDADHNEEEIFKLSQEHDLLVANVRIKIGTLKYLRGQA